MIKFVDKQSLQGFQQIDGKYKASSFIHWLPCSISVGRTARVISIDLDYLSAKFLGQLWAWERV